MNTDSLKKFAIIGAIILLMLTLAFVVKQQHDTIVAQRAMVEQTLVEFKELKDLSVRSQAQYSIDLEKWAKQNKLDLDPIKEDLSNLNAKLMGISTVLVATPGFKGTNISSTSTTPHTGVGTNEVICPSGDKIPCPDPFGYAANVQTLKLQEPFSNNPNVPFGEVEFKTWEAKPWSVKIYPRNYSVLTVIGQDEEGRHYTYHKFAIESNGQKYPIKIDSSKFVEELPEASFRFNPHMFLGVDVGATVRPTLRAEVAPNIQVALFSHGKTKKQSDWTFLGLGASYQSQAKELGLIVTPVAYNLGNHLPLVDNLFVGPSLSLDTAGGLTVGGGLHVGL